MAAKEDKPEDIVTMLCQIDGLQGRAVSIDEDGDCSWTIVPAPRLWGVGRVKAKRKPDTSPPGQITH